MLFRSLLDHLRDRPEQPLPSNVREELLENLELVAEGTITLAEAFGLDPRARRDDCLRRVADAVGGDCSDWRRAELLSRLIDNFASVKWQMIRDGESVPSDDVDLLLVEAFEANGGKPPPRSVQHLYRLLSSA